MDAELVSMTQRSVTPESVTPAPVTPESVPDVGVEPGPSTGVPDVTGGSGDAAGSGVTDGPDVTGGTGVDVARIARAGVLNLIGAAISVVATIGLTVVVTRNATREVAGAYFTLTSIFLILAAAARLGADTGSVYTIAGRRARGETGRVRAALRVALLPTAVMSVVLLVVAWALAPWLARELFATNEGVAVTAIRVFALCLPAAVVGLVAQAAARGLGTTRPYILMERILRPGLQFVGAVLVVVTLGTSAWVGLAASYSVPYIATAALMLPWLVRLRRRAERRDGQQPLATTRADWVDFWRFSGPRAATGILTLALQRLDVIIVAVLRGPGDAALYAAATRFLVVGQTAANALSVSVQHRFSALLSVGRRADANRLYQMTTTWLILMTWPFYLTWAVLARPLMGVFGAGYTSVATVGVVLGLSMLVATACGMVSMVLEMAGNTGVTFVQTAVALTANIAIDLALVPRLGPLGAAIGWSAAILLNNIVPLITLYRRYRLFPIARGGLYAIAASVACFAALPLLGRAVFGGGLGVAGTSLGLGVLGYVGIVWRIRRTVDLSGMRALRRGGRG